MEHTSDVVSGLTRMRDEQLAKLVALASDPKKANKHSAQETLSSIKALEKAIEDQRAGGVYAKHKSVIQAITDYLEDRGHAAPITEIEDALLKGGFRGGNEEARSNIKRSISSFTGKGKLGRRTKQIREYKGLIGLGRWPDEKFSQKA